MELLGAQPWSLGNASRQFYKKILIYMENFKVFKFENLLWTNPTGLNFYYLDGLTDEENLNLIK